MPRRSAVGPDVIVTLDMLSAAFWRAAEARRQRPEARAFPRDLPAGLAHRGADVHAGRGPGGPWTGFTIHDPERWVILAPCFRDRVAYHALMAHVGPVLERGLVDDNYACRGGRGTLAAVHRAQHRARRFPVFVQIEICVFFASIDQERLMAALARPLKHPWTLATCRRILVRAPGPAWRGLPIGALCLQHFANAYLFGMDRLLLHGLGRRHSVRGLARYMDDVVWSCDDGGSARATLAHGPDWLRTERRRDLKPGARNGASVGGLPFLGVVVRPGSVHLSRRKRSRCQRARGQAEAAWVSADVDSGTMRARMDAVLATNAHADARAWWQAELRRRQPVEA